MSNSWIIGRCFNLFLNNGYDVSLDMNHLYITLLTLCLWLVRVYWFACGKQVLKVPGEPEQKEKGLTVLVGDEELRDKISITQLR